MCGASEITRLAGCAKEIVAPVSSRTLIAAFAFKLALVISKQIAADKIALTVFVMPAPVRGKERRPLPDTTGNTHENKKRSERRADKSLRRYRPTDASQCARSPATMSRNAN